MRDAAHKGHVLHALQHWQDVQRYSRFDLNSLHRRIRLVARPRIGPAAPCIFTAALLALMLAILLLRKVGSFPLVLVGTIAGTPRKTLG